MFMNRKLNSLLLFDPLPHWTTTARIYKPPLNFNSGKKRRRKTSNKILLIFDQEEI